jgi:hypothetical protein
MKRGLLLGLLSGALLVGCMSAGVEVMPEQMATFRRGTTTLQEVTATLGPASVQTTLDDGSMLLVYTYVASRPHPESYLPFIGALIGGADTHSSATVFLFDTRGVLKSANTTTSNVGTGLSAERHIPPPVVQLPDTIKTNPPETVQTIVKPPVVIKSIPPAPDESLDEPLPEQEGQPAPEAGAEPSSE